MEEVRKLFDLLQVHNWLFFYFLFTRLFSRGSRKSMNVKKKKKKKKKKQGAFKIKRDFSCARGQTSDCGFFYVTSGEFALWARLSTVRSLPDLQRGG